MKAVARLRSIERTVEQYHGLIGLALTPSVLVENKSIARAALDFGADTQRIVEFWGTLFRKCLDVLAKALGLATTTARPRRIHPFNDMPNPIDPDLHAVDGKLVDPALRRGRANGHGR